jgi:hypothetical protein
VVLSVLLVTGGVVVLCLCKARPLAAPPPAPVRAAILGTMVMVSFFVLEFSDGLIRQDGRIFYWTSVLFLPALALLYGLVTARRWAWWLSRAAAALLMAWFAAFLLMIPFAELRTDGVLVPWWGRVYMMAFTLLLGGTLWCVFRALGSRDARLYFSARAEV